MSAAEPGHARSGDLDAEALQASPCDRTAPNRQSPNEVTSPSEPSLPSQKREGQRECGPGIASYVVVLLVAGVVDRVLRQGQAPLWGPLVGVALVVLSAVWPQRQRLGPLEVSLDMRLVPLLTLALLLAGGLAPRLLVEAPLGSKALCPLKVMAIFYGMAYLCLSVNETGLLRYVALRAAARTGSQRQAYLAVAAITGTLTLATSNDIVILTLTPIIIRLCREKGYDPRPLLYLEFVTANVWSISLLIGNPTNVIAAGPAGLSFVRYMFLLAPAGIASGAAAVLLVYFHFRVELRCSTEGTVEDGQPQDLGVGVAVQWPRAKVSAARLVAVLLFATLDVGVELWVSVAVACGVAVVSDLVMDSACVSGTRKATWTTLTILPWEVFAFALVLFIIVEALQVAGLVGELARAMAWCAKRGPWSAAFSLGVSSTLACQLLNNQPMMVLFAKVLMHPSFDVGEVERLAAYGAAIIGSNLGANLTLIGALAGPMWVRVAANEGVSVSSWDFFKTMLQVTPFVLLVALSVLCLELWVLGTV